MPSLPTLPTEGYPGAWTSALMGTWNAYHAHRIGLLAAGIAYWALLSLLPLLTLALSVAGIVLQDASMRADFVDWLVEQLPFAISAEDYQSLANTVESASNASASGTAVSLVLLAWSGTSIFGALRNALNLVFVRRGRGMIRGKLLDIVMLPTIGLLFILSFVATVLIQVAQDITTDALGGADPGANTFFLLTSHGVALLITVVSLLLVYRIVPNHTLGWRALIVPSILAGIALEISKVVIAIYLIRISTDSVYASLGSVFAFLFWAYMSSIIVLVGAAAAVELARIHEEGRRLVPPIGPLLAWPLRRLRSMGST